MSVLMENGDVCNFGLFFGNLYFHLPDPPPKLWESIITSLLRASIFGESPH